MPMDFRHWLYFTRFSINFFRCGGFMSTAKHTQGPWKPTYQKDGSVYIFADRNFARVFNEWGDKKNQAANAQLIAAAPELLEACKALIAYDESEKESDFVLMMVLYNEAITKARAAIAKAEGNV